MKHLNRTSIWTEDLKTFVHGNGQVEIFVEDNWKGTEQTRILFDFAAVGVLLPATKFGVETNEAI